MTQTRWFCHDCQREWADAWQWKAEHGCPACRSARIEQVLFTPPFPGGDLPRLESDALTADQAAAVDAEPAWTRPPDLPEALVRAREHHEANHTLAMACPELG